MASFSPHKLSSPPSLPFVLYQQCGIVPKHRSRAMSISKLDVRRWVRRRGALWGGALLATALLALPTVASAQATGSVTGRVTDARSGAAVEAAQVYLPGLNLGALSAANGRFLIVGVPAGT